MQWKRRFENVSGNSVDGNEFSLAGKDTHFFQINQFPDSCKSKMVFYGELILEISQGKSDILDKHAQRVKDIVTADSRRAKDALYSDMVLFRPMTRPIFGSGTNLTIFRITASSCSGVTKMSGLSRSLASIPLPERRVFTSSPLLPGIAGQHGQTIDRSVVRQCSTRDEMNGFGFRCIIHIFSLGRK